MHTEISPTLFTQFQCYIGSHSFEHPSIISEFPLSQISPADVSKILFPQTLEQTEGSPLLQMYNLSTMQFEHPSPAILFLSSHPYFPVTISPSPQ